MCAEVYRVGEPYELTGHRLVFTSWFYVRQGSFDWVDGQGNRVSVNGDQGPLDAELRTRDHPAGIKLTVRPAIRSGPLFPFEGHEWEKNGINIGTMLQENNRYRAWGNTSRGSSLSKLKSSYLIYFESEDGMNWVRPNCGIVAYNGNTNNNLVHGPDTGFTGTVFVDPNSEEERYKYVCEESLSLEEYRQYASRWPQDVESIAKRSDRMIVGIRGAVSGDGLRWKFIEEPLCVTHADTQVTGYYDARLGKFVLYSRGWSSAPQAEAYADDAYGEMFVHARRSINRTVSGDFRHFPLPEIIVEPSATMKPNEVFYTNCYTTIPGAPDHRLMFPTVWQLGGGDHTHLMLYSSRNGLNWSPVSHDPVFRTADFGAWDGGCLFASPNLLELPNGDFALPYTGWNVPHKYPRVNAQRNVGYAIWPKGRMVAVEAEGKGEFATTAIVPPGAKLRINAVTTRGGSIRIEAADVDGNPLPGREFAEAVPLVGDHHRTLVTWRNHGDMGIAPGQAVMLRFRMDAASIYGLEFKA
ncbi:hypothetical protein [Paenibacillus cymbidii]|uniref:hypothetical protein n=1 Tax=Paenibacillus cymbidii TaxID=1639034 RepID=UPI001080E1FE|nr:hypothetical protein [Paenibacillus cymbidii]